MKIFYVNKPLQYEIKFMKFYSAAANGLVTGAFQKCNWGQIHPMVGRGLIVFFTSQFVNRLLYYESQQLCCYQTQLLRNNVVTSEF